MTRHGSCAAAVTVAVSREAGARGGTIARRAAQKLSWQAYDQELLEYIAQEGRFQQNVVANMPAEHAHWVENRLQLLYHQPKGNKRILIPLIIFCHVFVKLRSLKICFPNSLLARKVILYLPALMVLRMLLVIASLMHSVTSPTHNLFASMMTKLKLSAIADMHAEAV